MPIPDTPVYDRLVGQLRCTEEEWEALAEEIEELSAAVERAKYLQVLLIHVPRAPALPSTNGQEAHAPAGEEEEAPWAPPPLHEAPTTSRPPRTPAAATPATSGSGRGGGRTKEEARLAIAEYLAVNGPASAKQVRDALSLGNNRTYEVLADRDWFETEGGKYSLTNEARQKVRPGHE